MTSDLYSWLLIETASLLLKMIIFYFLLYVKCDANGMNERKGGRNDKFGEHWYT